MKRTVSDDENVWKKERKGGEQKDSKTNSILALMVKIVQNLDIQKLCWPHSPATLASQGSWGCPRWTEPAQDWHRSNGPWIDTVLRMHANPLWLQMCGCWRARPYRLLAPCFAFVGIWSCLACRAAKAMSPPLGFTMTFWRPSCGYTETKEWVNCC